MYHKINSNEDFRRENPMTTKCIQMNPFQRFPIRFPQIPVVMRSPFGHPLNPRLAPMHRFPYNCNLNPMYVPLMKKVSQTEGPPIPPVLRKESNDNLETHFLCRLCLYSPPFVSTNVKDFQLHLNSHCPSNRPFVCQICRKVYRFRCLWRNHIITHMVIKRQNTSKPKEQDLEHVLDTNDGKDCEECGLCCKSNKDWTSHSRDDCSVHQMKCTECEYKTYTKTKLQRHEATHIRDRPFGCVECNSTFSQSGSLKGHLVKVHKITEFLVRCPYCHCFEAKNFGLLRTHIQRSHENSLFGYTLLKL